MIFFGFMGFDLLEVLVEDKDFVCIFARLVAKKMQEKKRKSFVFVVKLWATIHVLPQRT